MSTDSFNTLDTLKSTERLYPLLGFELKIEKPTLKIHESFRS
jgi:hypothetical protein